MMIRISEGPTAADRHEARVPDLREDHGWHSLCLHPPSTQGRARATRHGPKQSLQTRWSIRKLVDYTERATPLCQAVVRHRTDLLEDVATAMQRCRGKSSCPSARRAIPNREDMIDPAILRPGWLDVKIKIERPDAEALPAKGKNFSPRGCIRRPMGHPPWSTTCTAVRGAPPLRKKVVNSQRTTKARRSHSLPLLTYSRLGGLRQDPGRAGELAAGPRTDEDMGARRACVVVDLRGRTGSTVLEAPVIRSASAVQRSTAASEVSR
jgi:hypothetical protein